MSTRFYLCWCSDIL